MIRAYVADNWHTGGSDLTVAIVLKEGDLTPPTHFLHYVEVGEGDDKQLIHQWAPVEAGLAGPGPTLRLPHDAAIALLGALHSHFQGVDDQRALRQDYDAERKRVDKLTDAVIEIARAGAAR